MEMLNAPVIYDMESFIKSIPDIISSKIITNRDGEIEEVHIVSYDTRSPKQISRDVQSALTATFDAKIDHKKISVAQINSDESFNKDYRLTIGAIGYCLMDNTVEIKVRLKKGDKEIESAIQGPNSRANIHRLIVQATLECVHNFLNQKNVFLVEDIVKLTIAKHDVLNIAITCVSNYSEELLVGSAILRKDDYETIVKATLDAINRKIVQLTT